MAATGYIVWSEQQRKQVNQGVFTSSADATAFIARIKKSSPSLAAAVESLDVITVSYK